MIGFLLHKIMIILIKRKLAEPTTCALLLTHSNLYTSLLVFAPESDIIPSPLEEYRRFIDDPPLFTAVQLYIRSVFSLSLGAEYIGLMYVTLLVHEHVHWNPSCGGKI